MITITKKVYFTKAERGRRRMADQPPASQSVPEGRTPRLAKLMALAIHFADLIRTGRCPDMTEIARAALVTQPRVSQVMNLLHLAPDIQEEILFLPRVLAGRDPIPEKRMRRICSEPSFARQRALWAAIQSAAEQSTSEHLGADVDY